MLKKIKNYRLIIFLLILLNLFLASWRVINGEISFHTDIARDFMVMQEIVTTHKPTLIGPRAGGIPGMFHGPLWFYLNLPAFILGGGNPIVVGWFWVGLAAFAIFILYFTGKRLFDEKIALLSSLLYSVFLISYTPSMFNSFGAVALFPLFFFLFLSYLRKNTFLHLSLTLFVLGLLVQFQVGFGGVMVFLTILYLAWYLIRKKRYAHFAAFFILLIPLSTFIVFDLKHDFLQTISLIKFMTTKSPDSTFNLGQYLGERIKGIFLNGLNLTPSDISLTAPITIFFIWLLTNLRNKKLKYRENYLLYFYLYIGFWLVMFAFKGTVWGFFYWAFLPVNILVAVSLIKHIDRKLFIIIYCYLFVVNFNANFQGIKTNETTWKIYYQAAKNIYQDANKQEFGYYVFSPAQYGYSGKYAISYVQKEFPDTVSVPYEKRAKTYIMLNLPSEEEQKWISTDWWIEHRANIAQKPDKEFSYGDFLKVKRYLLTKDEQAIPSDPTLIQDLTFR